MFFVDCFLKAAIKGTVYLSKTHKDIPVFLAENGTIFNGGVSTKVICGIIQQKQRRITKIVEFNTFKERKTRRDLVPLKQKNKKKK